MNKNILKFRILSIICIIILCIGTTNKIMQNDTFYIIKLGDFIYHHGLDKIDHYCWVAKLPYTYPHWLYDLFIYTIYKYSGYTGIHISVIITYIILASTIYLINASAHKNEFLSLLISLITIFSLNEFITARSQVISLILFNLETYFINKLIKKGNNKYIVFLALTSLLIANLHGTAWLFTFILYLPFIGEHLVYKLLQNKTITRLFNIKKKRNPKIIIKQQQNIKKVLISMLISFSMGIFTPSRICYTYVIRIMMGNSEKHILEHLPLTIIHHPTFIAIIVILIIVLISSKTKAYLNEIFMISGLILMALISQRHLAFFYTIGILYIAIIINRSQHAKKDYTLDTLSYIIIKNKLITISLIIILSILSIYKYNQIKNEKYISYKDYPTKTVNYIKDNLDYKKMKLYNGYNYGSYLLLNDIPVFIDSRCDLYLKEFNGMDYSIFNEPINIEYKYEKKFNKYKITHVIIKKDETLYIILKKDKNYNIIYQDKYFALFEKVQ